MPAVTHSPSLTVPVVRHLVFMVKRATLRLSVAIEPSFTQGTFLTRRPVLVAGGTQILTFLTALEPVFLTGTTSLPVLPPLILSVGGREISSLAVPGSG